MVRSILLSAVALSLLAPSFGHAQTEPPTSQPSAEGTTQRPAGEAPAVEPAPVGDGLDFLGHWEGCTSYGDLLVVDNLAQPDGRVANLTWIYYGGSAGEPDHEVRFFRTERVTDTHWRLVLPEGLGTLEAFSLSPDAVRIHFPDGMLAVMARVVIPDAAITAARPAEYVSGWSRSATTRLDESAQASVRSLAGRWEGASSSPYGEIPLDGSAPIEVVVVDAERGRIVVVAAHETWTDAAAMEVLGVAGESLTVYLDTFGEVGHIKFVSPDEIELTVFGEAYSRYRRMTE